MDAERSIGMLIQMFRRDAWAEGWVVEMVRDCWDWTCIFNRGTMGLANGLDIRKEGVKKMMSRFLVPFLVK